MENPALFAHGFPRAKEKAETDRVPPVSPERVQQADQRHHAQHDAEAHQPQDGAADPAAAGRAGHCAPPAPMTTCRRTISRAITFNTSVTRNSSNAISTSEAS